jgi:hypothetical protein
MKHENTKPTEHLNITNNYKARFLTLRCEVFRENKYNTVSLKKFNETRRTENMHYKKKCPLYFIKIFRFIHRSVDGMYLLAVLKL